MYVCRYACINACMRVCILYDVAILLPWKMGNCSNIDGIEADCQTNRLVQCVCRSLYCKFAAA